MKARRPVFILMGFGAAIWVWGVVDIYLGLRHPRNFDLFVGGIVMAIAMSVALTFNVLTLRTIANTEKIEAQIARLKLLSTEPLYPTKGGKA